MVMKQKSNSSYSNRVLLVLFLLAVFGAALIIVYKYNQQSGIFNRTPTPPGSNEPNFYYYKDQKIPLNPIPGKYAVRPKPDLTAAQLTTLFNDAGLKLAMKVAPSGWYVVQSDAGEEQSALSQLNFIEQITQVYRAKDGTEYFIPDQFFVQFNPSVSEEEIRAFNEEHGVFIVEKIEWLGNNYLLQVDEKANRTGLGLANLYHESPLTEYAAPNFIRFTFLP